MITLRIIGGVVVLVTAGLAVWAVALALYDAWEDRHDPPEPPEPPEAP